MASAKADQTAPVQTGKTYGKKAFIVRCVIEIGIFSAITNLLLLVSPIYMLQIYDRVLPAQSFSTLTHLSIICLGAMAVLGAIEVVRAAYANRVASQIDTRFGADAFLASLNGSRASLGDVQPLRDMVTIRSFIASRTVFFLFDLPFSPIFLILLYFINPVLLWVTLAGVVILSILAVVNQLATGKGGAASSERLAGAMSLAQSFARSTESIRALGMTANVGDAWGRRFAESLEFTNKVSATNAILAGLSRSLRAILQMSILGVGAYLVLHNQMTAGMIFASSLVSSRALQPLDQIIGGWRQIVDSHRAWRRLSAISEMSAATAREDFSLPEMAGDLSVESLVYAIPNQDPGNPLLKRISFKVPAGQSLAIIGPSRVGKSTLARLIVGALKPNSGSVRLDGADIRNFDPDVLGRRIGYLAQDVELFPGTVAQNIARFDPGRRDEEVVVAAKRAHAHELVLGIKKDYLAEIGPTGVRLSGGERQRVGLARALYGNPKLLVLDEPNAHLDAEGEMALERVIEEARELKTTVVMITHKPAIAGRCDLIMVMRDGQVDAFGPAQEILRRLVQPVASPAPAKPAQAGAAGAGDARGALAPLRETAG